MRNLALSGGTRSRWAVAGLVVAFLLTAPTLANAATIEVATVQTTDRSGAERPVRILRYRAGPDERNRLDLVVRRTFADVADPAGLETGSGCELDSGKARCDFGAPFSRAEIQYYGGNPIVTAHLGSLDDQARVRGIAPNRDFAGAALFGEDGDDVLEGERGAGIYLGGNGDDRMVGRGTFDVFEEGPTSNGSDTMVVRGPASTVSYARRGRPVRVDLRGGRDSGETREGDRIITTARGDNGAAAVGGRGADHLIGNRAANTLTGGAGLDRLVGNAGDDVLDVDASGSFADGLETLAGRTPDRGLGGPGNDYLVGNRGPNRLVGGGGQDTLLGGPGSDRLLARDRSRDEVGCGAGRDTAVLDGRDNARARRADRCERVGRRGPALAVVLGGAGENLGGAVAFRGNGEIGLACPGDAAAVCRGRIDLVRRGIVVARGSFGIARGRKRVIALRVTRRGRDLIGTGTLSVQGVIRSRDRSGALRSTRVRTSIYEAFE